MRKICKALFLALMAMFAYHQADACTNLIVTPAASTDGSVMITYAADSHQLYGELYFRPAMKYGKGAMVPIYEWDTGKYLGEIPQVAETYSVIGNMNEYQLAIGETTFGGRPEFADTTGLIDYGSLIYLTLQRAKTAREAIHVMDDLLQTYGYYSSGESFSIADKNEVWIMEVMAKIPQFENGVNINKGTVWVAKRIPDGYISAHANQARITTIDFNDKENCLYSEDVIDEARKAGIFSGSDEEFSFCDVYAPLDFGGARGCEARVWAFFNRYADGMDAYVDYAMGYDLKNHMPLYVKPNRQLSVKDLADMMRDHYEGTPMDMTQDIGAGGSHLPYRWRPMGFEYEGKRYVNERAIATQQTGWWFVSQSRKWLPDEIGGRYWFGVDDAATSPLMPFYCCATGVPYCVREGVGSMLEYSRQSMFWAVNRIAQFAYLRYDEIGAEVRNVIDKYENHQIQYLDSLEQEVLSVKKKQQRVAHLTQYGVNNAMKLFRQWKDLDEYLMVKYIDGNIKRQNADGSFQDNGHNKRIPASPIQKPYSEKWIESVVNDHGQVLMER
ncbi:MAG: C69 family dipeptidase [Bacteroidales bacterium]|nr:C69 family dipeptidase [Bacteroidales bacterium]